MGTAYLDRFGPLTVRPTRNPEQGAEGPDGDRYGVLRGGPEGFR